ncbi:zinc ribbon domain-containing protein [Dictyobacter arantiisoli]|uniref:Zinc-ribbon domain-containing protein n=1 Tax=Dictyobacter arantiisoli TaxID=2014874 RepID=A0A5A5TEW8_9CHLR|nr:zinc ribbon domain-containing protein [Dictyobacter arantiisoli]GCF10111.1 hypothetical protein KDI_36750 [Dictyobacter arantiisoli]
MTFCGQCGLQLAPGSTRCPRCGAVIEETSKATAEELHPDDATIATPSLFDPKRASTLSQSATQSQQNQQPLILRPGINSGQEYGTQNPATYNNYDATNMMDQVAPPQQNSYPGYPAQTSGVGVGFPHPQSGSNYPQQGMYPDFTTNGGYNTGMSYPNMPAQQMSPNYPNVSGHYPPQVDEHAARAARGRTTGLVLVLFGLVLILGAVVLFAMQNHILGNAQLPNSQIITAMSQTVIAY